MTTLSSHIDRSSSARASAPADDSAIDEALGWEGHVNVPPSPVLAKLLRNWPELRTGLAFSMVFVVGALVGSTLFAAFGCHKKNSNA